MSEPYQPPPPAQPAPKKGMGPLAWIGIGCGVIIVIGIIVMVGLLATGGYFLKKFKDNPMAAAEMIINANPDLEVVSSDPKTKSMTIKNVKTGEVVTLTADDIEHGRISVKTKDGTTTINTGQQNGGGVTVTDDKGQVSTLGGNSAQNLPAWVPSYPGGTVQGTYDTTGAEGRTAAFTVTTTDDATKVLDWYEAQLKNGGLTVERTTFSGNGQSGGMLSGKNADEKQQVSVMISTVDTGGSSAVVTFQEKK
ncbi:MAG: hypothetical protein ACJ75H_03515 [Thermoanaerobaculia bacterium]